MKEAVSTSETSVISKRLQARNIPEDSHPQFKMFKILSGTQDKL
jgi:hypothetical protein